MDSKTLMLELLDDLVAVSAEKSIDAGFVGDVARERAWFDFGAWFQEWREEVDHTEEADAP